MVIGEIILNTVGRQSFLLKNNQNRICSLEHRELLGEEENCIRALAERLVQDIPINAQLMAYHASTEINVIKYLAENFFDLADHLTNLRENFVDLIVPFQKSFYYDPKQKGSNSIKNVMPALCPEMKGTPEYDVVRDGMLKYCGLDTLSMVEVMKVLKRAI